MVILSFVRHKELRFIFPILPFALLASAPVTLKLSGRIGALVNFSMLGVAFLLYRDPHGGLVRGLDVATRIAGPVEMTGLAVAEITGGLPRFYMRKPLKSVWINSDDWKKVCKGDLGVLDAKEAGPKREWIVISGSPCEQSEGDVCRLERRLPRSMGSQLRQGISRIPAPQWVYRCAAKTK
jgi:hypothetical protein